MCDIINYQYLDRNHKKGFDNYKYNSKDTSPLSNYVMHPFWNLTVKLVPMWIAPNVLTTVGFLFTVANGLLLTIYDPQFYASSDIAPAYPPIPSFVWLLCAIFHFLAHTLDGIDGKHARRTRSSGPLGELMDHGMDSWTTFFIPFCIYSIFGRADYSQNPLEMLFIFWSIYVTFYLSHWEKYNTGVLYLPWSYDVSQIALFALYLITFFDGYTFWKFAIPIFGGITSGRMFLYISFITSFLFSVPLSFYNVYTVPVRRQSNLWESFRPLVSLVILFVTTTIWAVCSQTKVLDAEPRTFFYLIGTVFSNIACRLIVSQMSSSRCELFNWLLAPITASTLAGVLLDLGSFELHLLRANALLCTAFHLHYGVCVVRQLCEHFNINCFTLGRRTGGCSSSSSNGSDANKSPELENLGKQS